MRRSAGISCLIILLVFGNLPMEEAQTSQNREEYVIDVHSAGAVGDGAADDTEAIANAATTCGVKSGILYFPPSRDAYTTTKTVNLPAKCTMEIDGTLKATAPMDAVVTVGADGTANRRKIFGAGVIDSGNQAKRIILMQNYANFEITGITLMNGAPIAGIEVGPEGTKVGFEAYIHDIKLFVPPGVASVPGNAGIWTHKGTDSSVSNMAIVGWDTGVRNSIHNNQPFSNIHVWGFGPNHGWKDVSNLPTVCFDDEAGDARWTGDECDTPSRIGLRAHAYNDQITGFSCFNNELWGTDNVVNCIQFDLSKPYSSVMTSIFQGKTGHRLASDVAVAGDNYTALTFMGNVTISNVVKSRASTPHLPNAIVENAVILGGPLIRLGGAEILPKWASTYAGGEDDKSVQMASGPGVPDDLPAYGPKGGLADSGRKLAGSGKFVPAVGNSIGCLDGWDHLPCTVAKLEPKTMASTSSISPATVFTTTAPGVYQVSVTFHSLGGASGGTAVPVAVLGQLNAPGTAASMKSTGADGVSTATITMDEGPGVALGYALNLSNASPGAKFGVSMEVVRLQ